MESTHDLLLPIVDEENICLPLAVNVVAKYWNIDLPLSEAVETAKKYPNVNGSILIEGIELAERRGLSTLVLCSNVSELKKMIDMGIPPIVIIPGIHETIQHASVISGYDNDEKTIIHYIPQTDRQGSFQMGVIPEKKFSELWSEDGNLVIVLAPSDIISELKSVNEDNNKSNKLCFNSERLNLLDQKSDAIDSLKKAIELDPKNSTAYSLLGSILNESNSKDCESYYRKSIDINNRNFLAYRGLGNFYLKTKQYQKAEEFYTRALEINPHRNGPIYKNRGIVRLEQNKKNDARKDLERYLDHTPHARDKESIQQAIKEL